jgi:hypothetical protein
MRANCALHMPEPSPIRPGTHLGHKDACLLIQVPDPNARVLPRCEQCVVGKCHGVHLALRDTKAGTPVESHKLVPKPKQSSNQSDKDFVA